MFSHNYMNEAKEIAASLKDHSFALECEFKEVPVTGTVTQKIPLECLDNARKLMSITHDEMKLRKLTHINGTTVIRFTAIDYATCCIVMFKYETYFCEKDYARPIDLFIAESIIKNVSAGIEAN